jgi:hypothetical protein
MQPTDKREVVQASVGLFFADRAPERTPMMLRLGRQNIDIAAGASHYVEEDTYVLPVDLEVRAVQPHAHYRAREVRSFATLPDGTRKWLLYRSTRQRDEKDCGCDGDPQPRNIDSLHRPTPCFEVTSSAASLGGRGAVGVSIQHSRSVRRIAIGAHFTVMLMSLLVESRPSLAIAISV